MLEARNLSKTYSSDGVDYEALKNVDLTIKTGDCVAIVGKSGAGKSTLLHILGTLDRADKGQVMINGKDVSKLSNAQLADFRNKNLGFIFQFHHLLPEFSALENVTIPALISGGSEAKAKKRAAELLDYLGLSARLTHKPTELSGGEQQRVAVARALMNNPAVVFADEPTGNLDSASSKDLHDLLFKLREDFKQTFVIVTHNDELAHLSDRILTMQDGVIL